MSMDHPFMNLADPPFMSVSEPTYTSGYITDEALRTYWFNAPSGVTVHARTVLNLEYIGRHRA